MSLVTRTGLVLALTLAIVACAPAGSAGPTSGQGGGIVFADGDRLLLANPAAGGPVRELVQSRGTGTITDPAWSPDGARLAYSFTPVPTPKASFGSDIYVAGADGSNPRVVFTHDVDAGLARAPAWSRDGAAIYFAYSYSTRPPGQAEWISVQQLVKLDLASGVRSIVATDADAPVLAPTGNRLAYIGVPADTGPPRPGTAAAVAVPSLWLADLDGRNARALVNDPSFTLIWSARFAPDGRSLVFTAAGGARSQPRLATTLPRMTGAGWPPAVAAHGFPLDLWLVDVETGKTELLAALAADDLTADWSPDGKRLALQCGAGLFILDLAAGTVAPVTSTAGFGALDWAP